MDRSFARHFVLAGALFLSAGRAFGSPAPHQTPQPIIVNGQQAEGVTVTQNGSAVTFYCPNPQPYTAVDQSSSGWACFDANSGRWSLNAMPPACANVPPTCANVPPACTNQPPACVAVYKPRRHHAAPYDHYVYAYPDYTYYPEDYFGGGPGHGYAGH
jgi:hypothetical protein